DGGGGHDHGGSDGVETVVVMAVLLVIGVTMLMTLVVLLKGMLEIMAMPLITVTEAAVVMEAPGEANPINMVSKLSQLTSLLSSIEDKVKALLHEGPESPHRRSLIPPVTFEVSGCEPRPWLWVPNWARETCSGFCGNRDWGLSWGKAGSPTGKNVSQWTYIAVMVNTSHMHSGRGGHPESLCDSWETAVEMHVCATATREAPWPHEGRPPRIAQPRRQGAHALQKPRQKINE
ncbi:hypothetical protein P7K49_013438, partial [Saguinus oedipus]